MKLVWKLLVVSLGCALLFSCTSSKKRANVNESFYGRSDRGIHGYPAKNSEDATRAAFGG
jgi:hypothetical protein